MTVQTAFRAIFRCAAGAALAALLAVPAMADSLPSPEGPVLLTVEGRIGNANAGAKAEFDDAMLSALPQVTFTTQTIWTKDRAVTFSGPSLAAVLQAVDAQGNTIEARAINDYMVKFARSDLTETAPIVANRIDGQPFNVRANGPLWIVFPYDAGPEFQSELVYAQSIWQLVHLKIGDE